MLLTVVFRRTFIVLTLLFVSFLILTGFLTGSAEALTAEEERKLGKQVLLDIERKSEIVDDLILQGFIERVGRSLVSYASPAPFDFQFFVIKEQSPNAFAAPGGYVFVTTGLLVLAENEDEVAGVLSHEIAHVTSRHISEMIDRSKRINLASAAAILLGAILGGGGQASGAVAATAAATAQALTLKYTRENETEADQNGLHTLARSGYDPRGFITFMNKMYKYSLASSVKIPTYLTTHPALDERLVLMENLIRMEPKSGASPVPPGNYKWVQARAFVAEREPHVAVSHFEGMVKSNGEDVVSLVALALAYNKMGRFDKSVEALYRASTLATQEIEIKRALGVAYFLSGKLNQSIEMLEPLSSSEGKEMSRYDDLVSLYYLGRAYQEKGEFGKALPALLKVQREAPAFAEVYLHLGSVYGRTGEKGLSHFYFGKHFKFKGDGKNALLHFRTALPWLSRGSPEAMEAQREIKELTEPGKKEG
jgi:predicted Zn-dependent protease